MRTIWLENGICRRRRLDEGLAGDVDLPPDRIAQVRYAAARRVSEGGKPDRKSLAGFPLTRE